MGQTMAEKILSAHSGSEARAGDLVIAELDYVMAGDAKGPKAVDIFREAGFEFRMDPKKTDFIIDHFVPAPGRALGEPPQEAENLRRRARRRGVRAGRGRLPHRGDRRGPRGSRRAHRGRRQPRLHLRGAGRDGRGGRERGDSFGLRHREAVVQDARERSRGVQPARSRTACTRKTWN